MPKFERAIHLDYYEPAEGKVPNPGMGVQGYAFSDHMHFGFGWQNQKEFKLDRNELERMAANPHCDNLYYRCEWKDIQKEPGKLDLPKEWDWMLEMCRKYNKKWSFRIMPSNVQSEGKDSVPDFIRNEVRMIPYWRVIGPRDSYPKYFAEYSEKYIRYWNEMTRLLGERFDDDPLLEFADVSGYGFWGEAHHYCQLTAEQKDEFNWCPDNVEEVCGALLQGHLDAFPKTPACMNLHFAEFDFGLDAIRNGDVWVRRDSFQPHLSTLEYDYISRLKTGGCMIWETVMGHRHRLQPLVLSPLQFVRHGLDFGANFFAVGFNVKDFNLAAHSYPEIFGMLDKNLGYRLRPGVIWRRELPDRSQEIAVELLNDGCGSIPGVLTLTLTFPDGRTVSRELPAGAPLKGDGTLYAFRIPDAYLCGNENDLVRLTASLRMRGKTAPVRWAVKQDLTDPFVIEFPLREFIE